MRKKKKTEIFTKTLHEKYSQTKTQVSVHSLACTHKHERKDTLYKKRKRFIKYNKKDHLSIQILLKPVPWTIKFLCPEIHYFSSNS